MPRYKLMVLTRPVEGRDQEFNDWYTNVHLDDLVAIDGIVSAQRFRAVKSLGGEAFPYLSIYEIEADDVAAVTDEIQRRSQGGEMFISEALDPQVYAVAYEEIGPAVLRR